MKFDSLGGRKFIFAIFVVLLSAILVVFGFVGESNYTMIVLGSIGAFIGGNVAQKALTQTKGESDGVYTESN